jgi:hypothetical protein
MRSLLLSGLLCIAGGLAAQPAFPVHQRVDSFMRDSGIGFDGHHNRCVWVYCGKRTSFFKTDTLRVIKLCGGMIGNCYENLTFHHWDGNGWRVTADADYLRITVRRREYRLRRVRSDAYNAMYFVHEKL